jgi:basic membrane lipoprotein Med (substrate-binding protein (PBP1-ABC) superfamily)
MKYKYVYDLELKRVIDVIEYDSAVSDSKGLEIVARLEEKLAKLTQDRKLIDENAPKGQLISAFKQVLNTIEQAIKDIKEDIRNHAATTFTTQNIFVGNKDEAKKFFDSEAIDYSWIKE